MRRNEKIIEKPKVSFIGNVSFAKCINCNTKSDLYSIRLAGDSVHVNLCKKCFKDMLENADRLFRED